MGEIASRLLNTILEKEMSYGELANLTGIPKSALQRYATGTTDKIPIDRLEKIAKALGVSAAYFMGWEDAEDLPMPTPISDDAHHVGVLYDRADEKDKMLTHTVLDKYEDSGAIVAINTKKKNSGGFIEFDVYDEPAAAGFGNYLAEPQSHREQLPAYMIPKGADFGIRISGSSMEPAVSDGATVFVKQTMAVESGKVGIFVLNGSAFCKQLIVDRQNRQVRLHSFNPKYEDIIVEAGDDLRTIGQVL